MTWLRGDRVRSVMTLAAPIVGGMVSQNLLNLVDTAMVGSLGRDAVAGVGIASFVFFVSCGAIVGLSSSVQAIAARRVGEGRPLAAASGLHGALLISLVVGTPLALVLYVFAEPIFALLLADPGPRAHAVPYYQARLLSVVAVGANFAFRGFFNGVSKPGLYLRTLLLMHAVNVVVSYGLIYGVWGLPELGSEGAGLGTAIAAWVGAIAYALWNWQEGRVFGLMMPESTLTGDTLRSLVRLAVPASIQQTLFSGGMTVLFWIVGRIGTAELAAANVLINVILVGILPSIGAGLAATSLVGQALGRGDPEDAWIWGWDVAKLTALVSGSLGVVLAVGAVPILTLFLPTEPEVVALATWPLRISALSLSADAIGLVLLNALLGAGSARVVMRVSIVFQWVVFLPLAYLLGPVFGLGLLAVWVAQALQRVAQAVVLGSVWNRRGWASHNV